MNKIVLDIECYKNHFMIGIKQRETGEYHFFEKTNRKSLDLDGLMDLLLQNEIIGFNILKYDIIVIEKALTGASCLELKEYSDHIIKESNSKRKFFRAEKLAHLKMIDLIEYTPGRKSLKTLGARLGFKKVQELPYEHTRLLSEDEMAKVKSYNKNDLDLTEFLFNIYEPLYNLRLTLNEMYDVDVTSKSEAQCAETIISTMLNEGRQYRCKKPTFKSGEVFKVKLAEYYDFKTPCLIDLLEKFKNSEFTLNDKLEIVNPDFIEDFDCVIHGKAYTVGVGGLHSVETEFFYETTEDEMLVDCDVTSYYPNLICNLSLYPSHLGKKFVDVYRCLKTDREQAKREGNKTIANSLKIVINGGFGKTNDMYSILRSPHVLLGTTINGQLSLLQLIEMLGETGLQVVSTNTDGILTKVPKSRYEEYKAICDEWSKLTDLQLEYTKYRVYAAMNVNNYFAITDKDKDNLKVKGAFVTNLQPDGYIEMAKRNANYKVCVNAVLNFFLKNIPIEDSICSCKNFVDFVNIGSSKDGIYDNGDYLGHIGRWYHATTSNTLQSGKGNKLPFSDKSVVCMELPDEFPSDVNYRFYIKKAYEMLEKVGYYNTNLF